WGYWRAMAMRISLSVSVMRAPERSTVTVWRVAVERDGGGESVVTAEAGVAPQGGPPGVDPMGGGAGEWAWAMSWPARYSWARPGVPLPRGMSGASAGSNSNRSWCRPAGSGSGADTW